jgi:hypothetical protein
MMLTDGSGVASCCHANLSTNWIEMISGTDYSLQNSFMQIPLSVS